MFSNGSDLHRIKTLLEKATGGLMLKIEKNYLKYTFDRTIES